MGTAFGNCSISVRTAIGKSPWTTLVRVSKLASYSKGTDRSWHTPSQVLARANLALVSYPHTRLYCRTRFAPFA